MKCLSTFLGFMLFTFLAFGQIDRDERGLSLDLRVGPKVGINASSVSGDIIASVISGNTDPDPDGITAIRAGGFVEIGVSDAFFVQPEVLYSAKGYEYKNSSRPGTEVIETNFDYLSVPILAKYAFVNNRDLQVSAQAGPYVGILLSAESGDFDISNSISDLDVGGQVGVGGAYSAGPGSITLDVRASFGFTNVYDDSIQFSNLSATNQVLPSATVGYAFDL